PFATAPGLRGAAGPTGASSGPGGNGNGPARGEKMSLKRDDPAPRDAGRAGWLSDLLERASEDEAPVRAPAPQPERVREPAPQPRQDARTEPRSEPASQRARGGNALDSLNSISVDIARMIVHEAAVDFWNRYEPGVMAEFEPRLYTQQGRQTFEEIRRKYRRDADFRQTVDRYVEEFERLLTEVARDDRDQVLTRTYLTSETGKVYTMLAHASGRLA
ncbi:hypothetical protein ACTZWW_07675, partial [Salinarimonas sp. NSM]|uniref:hypothetical protein n=1 Tax=Salinarimonas sp. NSM TaxID=3458003 RepID=UPI0040351BB9